VGFIQAAIWSSCAVAFLFGGYLIRQNNGFNIGDLITVFGMMLFACIGLSQALAILPEFAKVLSSSYDSHSSLFPFCGGKILILF
jgi:hypothetical protein